MAWSLVQSNAGAQNTGLGTVPATWPTPATAGNLLILIVGADDYAAAPPSGWTESTGAKQQTFLGHYVWWKVAAGGESSVNYTIGSASPSCWITAEYAGLTPTPYDISNGQQTVSGATNATYTTPAIVPSTGDRLLIASMGGSSNAGTPNLTTWTNGFTERQDIATTLGGGTRDVIGLADNSGTGNGSASFSSGATFVGLTQARTGIVLAFKVAASGTQYTASVGGTLTSAGALVKQIRRGLAGGLTSGGALAKRTARGVGGTLSSGGALAKRPARALAGTLSSAGALARRTARGLVGTLASAGALVGILGAGAVLYLASLAGTLSSAGGVSRRTARGLAGTLSSGGALAKRPARALAGTLSSAGALARRTARGVGGSLSSAGSLVKVTARGLVGALSSVGQLVIVTGINIVAAIARVTVAIRPDVDTVVMREDVDTIEEREP